MIGAVHILLVVEGLDRHVCLAVGQPHQDVRQGQRHVAGILGIAEGLPLGVLHALEDLGQVTGRPQLRKAVQVEHRRRGRGDERRMGGRRHLGDLLQKRQVLGVVAELVIADQRAVGAPPNMPNSSS